MALTLSGTNGVVGAGFTLDASGASVTAGVGTFGSLNAPAAGLTGSLPALDAANLTSIPAANIVGLATAGFNRSGGFPEGVTTAYQFRLTSGLSLSNSTLVLTANWEKVDGTGQGGLGSFDDPSSGVFTFPSTGFYLVRFNGYFEDTGDSPKSTLGIMVTTNNGTDYSTVAQVHSSNSNLDTYTYSAGSVETLVDVTDTSNVKVKFSAFNHSASLDGSSNQNRTYVTFIRLGDT